MPDASVWTRTSTSHGEEGGFGLEDDVLNPEARIPVTVIGIRTSLTCGAVWVGFCDEV